MHCLYDLYHHPDDRDEAAEVELDFQTLHTKIYVVISLHSGSILGKQAKYKIKLLENDFISPF